MRSLPSPQTSTSVGSRSIVGRTASRSRRRSRGSAATWRSISSSTPARSCGRWPNRRRRRPRWGWAAGSARIISPGCAPPRPSCSTARSRRCRASAAGTCWRCARRSTWTRPTSRSTARARSASAGATPGCGPTPGCSPPRWPAPPSPPARTSPSPRRVTRRCAGHPLRLAPRGFRDRADRPAHRRVTRRGDGEVRAGGESGAGHLGGEQPGVGPQPRPAHPVGQRGDRRGDQRRGVRAHVLVPGQQRPGEHQPRLGPHQRHRPAGPHPGVAPADALLALAVDLDVGRVQVDRRAHRQQVPAALPRERRRDLLAVRPTIDLDPTDVEVYGEGKERIGWSYAGVRAGRPVPLVWAESGLVLTGTLLAGDQDVRPHAPALIAAAVAALPDGVGRPRLRADSGLFSAEVAGAALAADADFAIAAARNPAVRRAIRSIPKTAWRQAKGMPGAQVATIDYAPTGQPAGTRMIVRRMKVKAADISTDVRARRRRTFDPAQLALALGGQIGHAYAYSPIVTNLTGSAVAIEAWFRDRAWVEERIKDSKLGMALRHLPSGYAAANEVWMWAAFLALSLSAALQALTGHDQPHRAHGKRLRRELITVPARVVHHARRLIVRLAPGQADGPLTTGYDLLRALPGPAG